ncbi:DUF262 domain-containing protein [Streptococcus suis]|nr:DUF262 domain-containing protein [Streptococcus suis]
MKIKEFSIDSHRPLISVQDIVNFIDKGENYKKSLISKIDIPEEELSNFLHGIILTPDYQRQYRSTVQEESSIIESLLLKIPIPEIFLVKTTDRIQLRHVMDGQHRLTAIYRFVKGKFSLKNLEILDRDEQGDLIDNPVYEGKKFTDLDLATRVAILGSYVSVLEFAPFKDSEIEIELFKRYNKNSKPLEAHEISMATYFSRTSQLISHFIKEISTSEEGEYYFNYDREESSNLVRAFNITSNRKNKQKNHQEICIVLNIITRLGEIEKLNLKDGVKLSTDFLHNCSKLYEDGKEDAQSILSELNNFNQLILTLCKYVDYPISMQILDVTNLKGQKYHTGISMILAVIYFLFSIDFHSEALLKDIQRVILLSPLGDSEYRASSTNLRQMLMYLFGKNKLQDEKFESLTLCEEKLKLINLSEYVEAFQ